MVYLSRYPEFSAGASAGSPKGSRFSRPGDLKNVMRRELRTPEAQSGSVLLFALIAVMIGLALTGAMVSVSIANARSLREHQQHAQAFYVAEAGLQGSHYELADRLDPGRGWRRQPCRSPGLGELPGDRGGPGKQLLPPHLHGGVRRFRRHDRGSGGARSHDPFSRGRDLHGRGHDDEPGPLSGTTDLIVDGGDSPGVVFTDGDLYKSVTTQFAQAVGLGYIQEMDITGSVTNNFQPNDVDLSMAYNSATGNHSVTIYPTMYSEFFDPSITTCRSRCHQGELGISSILDGKAPR